MLGISTCWWDHHALDGESIIKEIIDLGLDGLELEYRITHPIYQQMKPLLNKAIKVLSIHNYFPKPNDFIHEKASGDLFLLSSLDNYERSLAVQYTLKTMEYASDLEVLPVVLHLGRVTLTRKHQTCWLFLLDTGLPRNEGFYCVARSPKRHIRYAAQAGNMFNRLVGRAIFSQTNRVVGIDE